MLRTVVVNSTPIIALAEIGQLEILKQVYEEVTIPIAVRDEVTAYSGIFFCYCNKSAVMTDNFLSSIHLSMNFFSLPSASIVSLPSAIFVFKPSAVNVPQ